MSYRIQQFGRFLSKMVMPNIGAFIAWGIITTLFHPNGWIPNESINQLVRPMIIYALPILIAYTGGRVVDEKRGGVVAVIATMGLIVGSDIPMFLGAMLIGPFSGLCIKKLDEFLRHRVPTGFEMLTNNFSAGILGAVLAIISFKMVGPVIEILNGILEQGVSVVVEMKLLFLASLFIEPGKILFLNNAINHGILGPLGIKEALESGKSIFFLLETNPGPGLGVLFAYWFYGKGMIRKSTPSAMIIHFFGGIHEIYFPYVLMSPMLFIAVVLGGMSGVFVFQLLGVGLAATPSPGSIFALLALASRFEWIGVVIGVIVSAIVSFLVSGWILSRKKDWEQDEEVDLFEAYKGDYKLSKIHFACDAGMGSSAMGTSLLGRLAKEQQINIRIENVAIDSIPEDAEFVITFTNLLDRAKKRSPKAFHFGIKDFLDKKEYEKLLSVIKERFEIIEEVKSMGKPDAILLKSNILLNKPSISKEEAIVHAGKLLYESGYVNEPYIEGMLAREKKFSTYIGNAVAIPHGENDVKDQINHSGIVVVQYPEGIEFGKGKIAKLVIGIAGLGNEHIQILANIAEAIEDETIMDRMISSADVDYIYDVFSSEGE
ncbi:MAG: PTS sugar transporter subunit IIA [Clostridia bacterium]|nr:PTS sugar transporter subunit IIA [Clostridia bacterium]